jgi:hypothetical protein
VAKLTILIHQIRQYEPTFSACHRSRRQSFSTLSMARLHFEAAWIR